MASLVIAAVALLVSVFNLFLHFREHWNESANILIIQDVNRSFYINAFIIDRNYYLVIAYVTIHNKSKLNIGLGPFKLTTQSDLTSEAVSCDGSEWPDIEKLATLSEHSPYEQSYAIKDKNLLSFSNIAPYGVAEGYLCFPMSQKLTGSCIEATLCVSSPRKDFSKAVIIPDISTKGDSLRYPTEEQPG